MFARTSLAKYCRLGTLNNRNYLFTILETRNKFWLLRLISLNCRWRPSFWDFPQPLCTTLESPFYDTGPIRRGSQYYHYLELKLALQRLQVQSHWVLSLTHKSEGIRSSSLQLSWGFLHSDDLCTIMACLCWLHSFGSVLCFPSETVSLAIVWILSPTQNHPDHVEELKSGLCKDGVGRTRTEETSIAKIPDILRYSSIFTKVDAFQTRKSVETHTREEKKGI